MRKLFSILISILLVVTTLTACGNKTIENSKTETLKTFGKFKGNIVEGTVFSEGLALISDNKNTYCINTDGEIVYKIDKIDINSFDSIYYGHSFKNGLIYVKDGFYDTKGNYIMPEDIGATKFYIGALKFGYIFADVGDDGSSDCKRGVLDTNFNWVVKPTVEYYQNCKKAEINLQSEGYFEDGYFFTHRGHAGFVSAIEILTGKTYKPAEFPNNELLKNVLLGNPDGTVIDFNNNIKFDVSEGENKKVSLEYELINNCFIAHFIKEYQSYFNLVDSSGNYLFNPIKLDDGLTQIVNTGKYVIAYSEGDGDSYLQVYDMTGNKILETEKTKMTYYNIGDDIIVGYYEYTVYNENIESNELRTEVKYYDMQFNQLF